ncbi:bifunctional metallophosphatase/5'-nucleotidase [Yinghuangia seranimata]|uniref:bifunctional metallophosphatase/5'-nucleotidase n=1 Tax=Yinghuangia seranimata TaxID=408067 RepID=UPI00248BA1E5|nr:bifunctional metallophosphatase/5'-nucleotidase [Yinghuangia seranimata]MDI2128123.1 bifunctional metallophosphatase/5'-nucleotidase [Yinghuangia seranimata]
MTARRRRRGWLACTAVAVAGLLGSAAGTGTAAAAHGGNAPASTMNIQLLALNDLHGNLEPPQGSAGMVTTGYDPVTGKPVGPFAGGVQYLATQLRAERAKNPNSLTVAAGDMIGASPLLSGMFHDEPTIEALNKIGLDVSAVGNHEFDEGRAELLRMQRGGCHPKDGCYSPTPDYKFQGANFPYLAANVLDEKTGLPILAPVTVKYVNGALVGFIGMTLEGTPDVVTAEGVKGLKFKDEVETANFYTKLLKAVGIKSIVVLLHEGGLPSSGIYNYDCNAGGSLGLSGPVVDIAKNLDPEIDAVVTGHTHQSYVCNIPDPKGNPRLVTSGASFGREYTDIQLTYDKRTRDIVRTGVTAVNKIVTRDTQPAKDMTDLIGEWNTIAAPVANRPVGYIAADVLGRGAKTAESPLGDVIADAQLEATKATDKGAAQIAFMNPGGIRSDFQYKAAGTEGDGVVTYGEAFTVQPFTNMMVTQTLTGQAVLDVLAQQVSGSNAASPRFLQISDGLTYSVDSKQTGAARIVAGSVKLNGVPIDPAATYRVSCNEFLAGGGDGFPAFKTGTAKLNGVSDLEALTAYLGAHSSAASPLAVPAANRITFVS